MAKISPTIRPEPTVWGERLPFGTICGEFTSPDGGWIHSVAFSPSGNILAYVCKLILPNNSKLF